METSTLHHLELILLLLLMFVAAVVALTRRLVVPYPITLTIAGLLLSLVPNLPPVRLDPDIVFLVILPPLVYSAAFHTSWRDFKNNLVSILMLAFGLVAFTMSGVALTTHSLFPGFTLPLGFVLGAVVCTTDAIAATAIAKRLGLPRRIVDLLEAESLVNDASGLVALKISLAALLGTRPITVWSASFDLLQLITIGVAAGLITGKLINAIQRRIEFAPVEITVSLLAPYLAYLGAESAGGSGVLACVVSGLYLGRNSSRSFSLHARIEAAAVWNTLDFILNGVVFLMIGLELRTILAGISNLSHVRLLFDGAVFSLVVIALRLIWVYPGAWISQQLRRRLLGQQTGRLKRRQIFIVGWTGMRGVLALAAAISLPAHLTNGAAFPQRNYILFLTFCVIVATLVVQGLSLPPLIRALGLARPPARSDEEIEARRMMIEAAMGKLAEFRFAHKRDHASAGHLDHLERYYRHRLSLLSDEPAPDGAPSRQDVESHRELARQLRAVERDVILSLRQKNTIHDEVVRKLEHELDLLDARFTISDG